MMEKCVLVLANHLVQPITQHGDSGRVDKGTETIAINAV
jgi:hypothetical protein